MTTIGPAQRESSMKRQATTVFPSRPWAFPPATLFTHEDEADYIRKVHNEYPGTFGICTCPAASFDKHTSWWRNHEDEPGN